MDQAFILVNTGALVRGFQYLLISESFGERLIFGFVLHNKRTLKVQGNYQLQITMHHG